MSLAPLIVASVLAARDGVSLMRIFGLGWLTGAVYFGGTLYWLAQVMAEFGGLSIIVAGLLAAGLAFWLAVFVGVFAVFVARAARTPSLNAVWLAPLFWIATEWIRSWLGGNFPWVLLGYSQARTLPILQLASVGGVPLLSGVVALTSTAAAMLALSRARRHRLGAGACAGLVVLASVWGAARMARNDLGTAGQPVRVGLVQGNVPQDQKWDPAYREEITRRYVDLSREALGQGAQLVLWPEASTPFYFDVDGVMAEPIRRLARDTRTPFVVGTDEFEAGQNAGPDRFFNAAALVGPDGRTRASYRKIRLVPFGEFVPFKRLLFFVGPLIEAVSDFSPGSELTVFDVEGTRFSVAICYEIIYADLARESVTRGSQLLTTITNDAWFGRSSAAYQHFEQASVRAVEQGRYLVRAANTGISGAVDPYGRVIASTPLFETRVLLTDVRLLSGRTVYAVIGDAPLYLSLAVTLLWLVGRRRAGVSVNAEETPRPAS